MKRNTNRNILFSGFILLSSLSFFFVYANIDSTINIFGIDLNKSKELKLYDRKKKIDKPIDKKPKDTLSQKKLDTTSKKILLIGDSEIEGLRLPFYDYCIKNKHNLVQAIIWYSASEKTIANSDTLKNAIAKYNPDYIVIVVGLNQMYQEDFEKSEIAVKKIIEVFDKKQFAWIGPANWVQDKGINDLYQQTIDEGCFFLSKNLILERSGDGRHPNGAGYKIWMDSIATWMEGKAKYPIRMERPDSAIKNRKINNLILNCTKAE